MALGCTPQDEPAVTLKTYKQFSKVEAIPSSSNGSNDGFPNSV